MSTSRDSFDPRIATYREFLEKVEREHLIRQRDAAKSLSETGDGGDAEDELASLGQSIIAVTSALTERFQEERQFAEVSREIVQGVYLDEVLNHVYDSFKDIIPYDRIGCAVLERHDAVLRAKWARTEYPEVGLRIGFAAKMAGSTLLRIIETGQPRIINDLPAYLEQNPDSTSTKLIVREGVRSSLTCPLVALGHPIGFLFFSSREYGRYASVHVETFTRLAELVSIAVEKSLLYEEMSRLNHDLTVAYDKLEYQAAHDGLTGLLNHAAIIDQLVEETDSQPDWPFTAQRNLGVIMIDVDHFKKVNDTYGHPVGDQVLTFVATTLSDQLRSFDRIGRFGGEEFLIVTEAFADGEPAALGERLRRAIAAQPADTNSGPVPVTISVGVAVPEPGIRQDAETLIRRADDALYRAKNEGRNRVAVSDD